MHSSIGARAQTGLALFCPREGDDRLSRLRGPHHSLERVRPLLEQLHGGLRREGGVLLAPLTGVVEGLDLLLQVPGLTVEVLDGGVLGDAQALRVGQHVESFLAEHIEHT